MDPASIASSLIGSQAGQTQLALAQDMLKINANAQRSIADMVEAAAQGASQANLPPGVGGRLDVAA